ncbi:hypothetical protein [Methanosarcina acetivorans]|uniref:hypothetical protein n=1 Tax=Methanosarcina acetivorans TaxID=2214 RepID=UPI00064E2252|nr:hypothetical protein [Methanosarcina acetivorans]
MHPSPTDGLDWIGKQLADLREKRKNFHAAGVPKKVRGVEKIYRDRDVFLPFACSVFSPY